jgi:trigger factor
MADTDHQDSDEVLTEDPDSGTDEQEDGEVQELSLEVKVETRSACERHITVTVSRDDIDRYFNKEYSELMDSAQVPGFRPGHAPRKLVESRFRKDVSERVKSSLLMDSMAQVNEQEDLSAISEPDLNLESVELPDEGAMTFEFNLEVRPDFDLPEWKGLKIERPVREFSDEDVDRGLERALSNFGQLVPVDGPATSGDYITTNLSFSHGDQVLSSAEEEVIRVRPTLSFRDGKIDEFDKLMDGVTAGDTREAEAELTQDAPNQALRGATVAAKFEVLEVKRLELPELTPEFLAKIGDFESEADLRDAIRDNLKRRLEYDQHQRARDQVTAALTESADWDLPQGLLERQSERELGRATMELRRSGFSDEEILAHENELRQNSRQQTARALKEHFILERIAENLEIEDTPEDYDKEIDLIAEQSGESPRRVRAQLEKGGSMDALRNQIIERKAVELILDAAAFEDVPYEDEAPAAEAVGWAAGGGEPESDIPEAKPEGADEEDEDSEATESTE